MRAVTGRCPECGNVLVCFCPRCRGRVGGEVRTLKKLEAVTANQKLAAAANRGRRKRRKT